MDIASISCPGGRKINEDRTGFRCAEGRIFAAVADGLGGHGSGDRAAECVVEQLCTRFPGPEPSADWLRDTIREANARVMENCTGKTTLAMVWGSPQTLFSVHVGDSRVYQFRDGEILFQSRDHSVSQLAVAVGEITQEEIRGHVDRNKLIRSLGSRDGGLPEVHMLTPMPGDGILICSDGFWENVLEEEMLDTLNQADSAEKWLGAMEDILCRRLTPKSDNYSAVTLLC